MDRYLVMCFLLSISGVVFGKPPVFVKPRGYDEHVEIRLGGVGGHNRPRDHEGRVIGGLPAAGGAWPSMVALTTVEGYFVCGASLVSPLWLVSAAHCFPKDLTDNFELVARIGATNLSANDELEKIAIRDIILNPSYVPTYTNDIAMLRLARPANVLRREIETIKIPRNDLLASINPTCYVIGWGSTSASQVYLISEYLTELRVNIISNAECQSRWSKAWTRPKIYDYNICVDDVGGTVSSCYGDSGGPLQCFSAIYDAWVLLGVSSWGAGSCTVYPSVYSRTVYYGEWMQMVMRSYSLSQKIKDNIEKQLLPSDHDAPRSAAAPAGIR